MCDGFSCLLLGWWLAIIAFVLLVTAIAGAAPLMWRGLRATVTALLMLTIAEWLILLIAAVLLAATLLLVLLPNV